MKKVFKYVLLILSLSFLLLIAFSIKVQAATTINSIEALQATMGASAYSTIEGTTIKINKDFTWKITNDYYLNIPELTIDFNGKTIRIENDKTNNLGLHTIESKVVLKDSNGDTGGVYSIGNFLSVGYNSNLVVENGTYTAGHVQIIDNGLITNTDHGLFKSNGGTITIKNGVFDTTENAILFQCSSGKLIINNGRFTGKGYFVEVFGRRSC